MLAWIVLNIFDSFKTYKSSIFRSSRSLVFLNVELLRNTIIRNYRRGMNAKRTFHHKILSWAFKRSFRRNSKSFLKAERRERNSTIIQWMARTNRNGETSRSRQDRPRFGFTVKISLWIKSYDYLTKQKAHGKINLMGKVSGTNLEGTSR